jgi:hypothetical protein
MIVLGQALATDSVTLLAMSKTVDLMMETVFIQMRKNATMDAHTINFQMESVKSNVK